MNARPTEAWGLTLFFVAWLLLISLLCLWPMPDGGSSFPYSDKLGHAGLFFIGGLIAGWRRVLPALVTLTVLAAIGGLLELLQAVSGFRHAEWADLLADSVGAAIGLFLAAKVSLAARNS